MNSPNNGKTRHFHVRGIVAYPAVTVALVVSLSLALTPFGPSQVSALAASATPTPTSTLTTPTPTVTTPSPTVAPPQGTTSAATTTPGLVLDPGAAFGDHHVLARIEGRKLQANYLSVDEAVPDAAQFQTFRVRFRIHNAGTTPITKTPRLEFRTEVGGAGFAVVPNQPRRGVPFHMTREWVPSSGPGGGTKEGLLGEDIAVANLRIGKEGGLAVIGHRSMGANPDQAVTLPSNSYTEQEFTITLSIDAKYLTAYELRITDAGTPLTGSDVATIRLGAAPAVKLSPGQRQGVAVVDPKPTNAARAAYPLLPASASLPSAAAVKAAPSAARPNTQTYPLVTSTLSAATSATDIHGPYTLTTNACATCHRSHAAQAPNLLVRGSQATLCLTCHDGTSTGASVLADYPTPPVNLNDPVKREYYSHDALAPSTHTRSGLNEFGGVLVPNRHSECADCHNSHKASSAPDSTQVDSGTPSSSIGWSASGRLAGVSGVSVLNGAAGTAPTYTFLSGASDAANEDDPVTDSSPISLEYQLCFKCHSGFTKLLAPIASEPSTDALDKGVELNPANPSFHPVEAKGKNDTAAMTASLAGTSPAKLWDFTVGSTIRCLNCHASGSTNTATEPTLTAPGAPLAPHSSSNRGILLKNYRDRLLKPAGEAYSSGDFALCYVCHAEEPFVEGGTASTKTNFSAHSQHLNTLTTQGDGSTSIDTLGAGQGNAICAECHFRIHSTTNKVGPEGNTRLVSFAPNVQPNNGILSFAAATISTPGSCTLTCHGHPHAAATGQTYPALPALLP